MEFNATFIVAFISFILFLTAIFLKFLHAFLCAAARGAAYPALFFDAIRRDLLRSRKICRAPSVIISLILKLREGVHEVAGEPQGG